MYTPGTEREIIKDGNYATYVEFRRDNNDFKIDWIQRDVGYPYVDITFSTRMGKSASLSLEFTESSTGRFIIKNNSMDSSIDIRVWAQPIDIAGIDVPAIIERDRMFKGDSFPIGPNTVFEVDGEIFVMVAYKELSSKSHPVIISIESIDQDDAFRYLKVERNSELRD